MADIWNGVVTVWNAANAVGLYILGVMVVVGLLNFGQAVIRAVNARAALWEAQAKQASEHLFSNSPSR